MKKLFSVLVVLLGILVVAGAGTFYYFTSKTPYYTQIVTTGERVISHDTNTKEEFVQYTYQQEGYDEEGTLRELDFMTHPDLGRPFREGAYLKVDVNRWKGELGYEEVQKEEIPQKALDKLK